MNYKNFINEASKWLARQADNLEYIDIDGGLYSLQFVEDFANYMKSIEDKYCMKNGVVVNGYEYEAVETHENVCDCYECDLNIGICEKCSDASPCFLFSEDSVIFKLKGDEQ